MYTLRARLCVLGSKKCQTAKKKQYIMCDSIILENVQTIGTESRLTAAWGQGAGSREGEMTKGHEETLSMEDMFFFLTVRFYSIHT